MIWKRKHSDMKPTRGQLRGYALLCAILSVILLLIIFLPSTHKHPEPSDHSQLKQAIAMYGDEMSTQNAEHHQYHSRRHTPRPYAKRQNPYPAATTAGPHTYHPKKTITVELNSADTSDLKLLYGIGSTFATRIVKYRQLLGGFVSTSQLLEVYGLSEELFHSIEPHITLDTSIIQRIAINSASLSQLRKHPYLDYYQAKAIIDYRKTVGAINNSQDLLKINLIDPETAKKISPYIQYY